MSKWLARPAGAKRECGRTLCAKVFDMGGARRRVVQSLKPVHYERNGELIDIDNTLEVIDGRICAREMQSPVTFYAESVGYQKGEMRLTLLGLPFVEPRIDGESVVYEWPERDLQIAFHVRRGMVRCVKTLGSDRSPREFKWKLETLGHTSLKWDLAVKGHDNADGKSRAGEPRRHKQRQLQIATATRELPDGSIEFTERWTGQTKQRDARTRVAGWSTDAAYPVAIDPPDITETIVTTNDDGYQAGSWQSGQIYFGSYSQDWHAGWRFQTVAVPQGATIDLAVLKVNVTSNNGLGAGGTLYGYDTDDAAPWADVGSIRPTQVAKTSATTAWARSVSTGSRSYTVTSIVQEIVNRAGWASGGDMSVFALTSESGGNGNVTYISDYSAGAENAADLEIDYTEGAPPGGSIAAQSNQYRRRRS